MSKASREWTRMTLPTFNSGGEDAEFLAYGQDGFEEVLGSFIGMDILVYDRCLWKEPVKTRGILQNVTADQQSNSVVRQLLCRIGTLHCGQYVQINGQWWMVNAMPDNNLVYEKGILWKCRNSIRFVSPLSGNIVEYPVYSTNSTQYGTGEDNRTNINIGEDQHLVYLPYNEETILIDNRFRFLMDRNTQHPTAYRVTRVDTVSYAVGEENENDGLIQWSVLETLFNERTDDAKSMVADLYTQEEGGSTSGQVGLRHLELVDTDGDFTLAVGESKTVRMVYTGADGECLDTAGLSAALKDAPAQLSLAVDGDCAVITAADDMKLVGQSVTLRVWDTDGLSAELSLRIVHW